MGDATRGEEAIALALKTPRNSDERIWLGDYGSSLRDNALMLSLLEENKLLPDEQYTLLNTLSQQAFGERWLSTQESNALFLRLPVRFRIYPVNGRRKPLSQLSS